MEISPPLSLFELPSDLEGGAGGGGDGIGPEGGRGAGGDGVTELGIQGLQERRTQILGSVTSLLNPLSGFSVSRSVRLSAIIF